MVSEEVVTTANNVELSKVLILVLVEDGLRVKTLKIIKYYG